MFVYVVYGQDWTYGHNTGLRGIFSNECHALQYAAKMKLQDSRYEFVAERWEVK